MDILKEYKKLAERQRQDLEQTGQDESGMHVIRCMNVISDLQLIYNYLHDLVQQINFVNPEVRTQIKIDGLGMLENLKQQDYHLITDFHQRFRVTIFVTL